MFLPYRTYLQKCTPLPGYEFLGSTFMPMHPHSDEDHFIANALLELAAGECTGDELPPPVKCKEDVGDEWNPVFISDDDDDGGDSDIDSTRKRKKHKTQQLGKKVLKRNEYACLMHRVRHQRCPLDCHGRRRT